MTSKVLSYNQWRQNDVKSVAHCRLLGSCVFCAPLDRYIRRHINWHSTNVLVDISAECQPICRPTYRSSVGYFVNQDVPADISTDISVEHELICQPTLDRYVRRYVDREWLSNCRPTCRSIGYRHSADIHCYLRIGDCRHHLTSRLVTSAAQISLIYSPLLRGFFVYNPACLSSVLYQHLVILHHLYPLSCQLYFVYLAVFLLNVLLDNHCICGTWRLNIKPSEIFEVDQTRMKCI